MHRGHGGILICADLLEPVPQCSTKAGVDCFNRAVQWQEAVDVLAGGVDMDGEPNDRPSPKIAMQDTLHNSLNPNRFEGRMMQQIKNVTASFVRHLWHPAL
ncbi:hypothetical protein H4S14_001068 [Agrobacterium vitis]|nr:hypothetical protein [Agrobacterium vitis]MBE1437337.1 hypothetical protein [Agrobacterium vitis]